MEKLEYIFKSLRKDPYVLDFDFVEYNLKEKKYQYWTGKKYIKDSDISILIQKVYYFLKRFNKKYHISI